MAALLIVQREISPDTMQEQYKWLHKNDRFVLPRLSEILLVQPTSIVGTEAAKSPSALGKKGAANPLAPRVALEPVSPSGPKIKQQPDDKPESKSESESKQKQYLKQELEQESKGYAVQLKSKCKRV
jgi:hypothetical protein